jgi:opacity protein-like surface antigen
MPAVEQRMLSLNGKFSPLDGRIQPYAIVGGGWVNAQADRVANTIHQSSFGMRFGVGVSVFITDRSGVALEAAYILPLTGVLAGGDRFDTIPITASLFFRFK